MHNRLRPCNELPLCIYSFGLLVLNRSSLLLLILNCFPARRDGRYTIFKNLTIIVIAYGEVLWFGGNVTRPALFSFGSVDLEHWLRMDGIERVLHSIICPNDAQSHQEDEL